MHDPDPTPSDLLVVTRRSDPLVARILNVSVREHQAGPLASALGPLVQESRGRLVLLMQDVQQLTSAGVNTLITIQDLCHRKGGNLVLVGLNHDLVRLFRVTGLDRRFPILESRDDAVAYFQGAADTRKRRRGKHAA